MNYQNLIENIYKEVEPHKGYGKVADYIPALANVNPDRFGIAVAEIDGRMAATGDAYEKFSIQSISKVFTLAMVVRKMGDEIWKCVGREPSGTAFNSLVQLEYECGRPRNPFINAGALVVTDRLMCLYERPKEAILDFIRTVSGNDDIYFDKEITRSERESAYRNIALANLMKSFGNIRNDVDSLIDVYCSQCAITMNCMDLARSFGFFANGGKCPVSGEQILSSSQSKRLGALMLTCGFYDESGDFAFRAGLPGKSGVGGGVVAYMPQQLSVAVWSPELDSFGNSIRGIDTLELFTTELGRSIF